MNLFELFVKIGADTSQAEKGMKSTQGVSETLTNKIKVMSAQFEAAQKNVDKLTQEFNESVNKAGATDKATQELAKKLADAEKEASQFAKKLDEVQKEAEQSEKALDGYNKELGETDQQSEKAEKGVSSFGKKIGEVSAWTVAKGQLMADAIKGIGKALVNFSKQSIQGFAEYEQLAGGAQKIFDQMDYSKIANDANNAYKELGLSANQYLAVINDVGATFAATMGDEAGYEAAKTGLKAISDYASGTGKNVDELSQKFTLITRSTSSYQSIADQFSGILPATSKEFLKQAQAAGLLSKKYTDLTKVPIAEYQEAVSKMLEKGVADLGLANNTMNEAFSTLSGSLSMAKGAWSNLVTGLADDSADLDMLIGNFVESVGAVATQLIPKIGTALNGASKLVRDLIPVIVQEIPVLIEQNLPVLAEAAVSIIQSLVSGISENQDALMSTAMETITYLATSLISMLPQIVKLGLDLIISLANGIAESLPTLIPTIIDVVLQIVDTLTNPDTLSSLVDASIAIIMGLAVGLIDALPGLLEKAPEIIQNLVTAIVENVPKLLVAGCEVIKTLVQGLIDNFSEILAAGEEIVNSLIEGVEALFTDLSDLGKDIIDEIKEGISKAWEGLTTWFNNLWDSLFGNRSVDVNVNGNNNTGSPTPNANGISYVPYDGYYSVLHKGERVLTAEENKAYNSGVTGNTSGITIVQNIQAVPKTPAEFAASTAAYFEQARWAI